MNYGVSSLESKRNALVLLFTELLNCNTYNHGLNRANSIKELACNIIPLCEKRSYWS